MTEDSVRMEDDSPPEGVSTATMDSVAEEPQTSKSKTAHTRISRKRTKTGCLTCRKRRIKCSEERPICGNCIKSKRHCEGYNQRVIFKDPLSTYRHPASMGSAHGPSHRQSTSSSQSGQPARLPSRRTGNESHAFGAVKLQLTTEETTATSVTIEYDSLGHNVHDLGGAGFGPQQDVHEVGASMHEYAHTGTTYEDDEFKETIDTSYLTHVVSELNGQRSLNPSSYENFVDAPEDTSGLLAFHNRNLQQLDWLNGPRIYAERPPQEPPSSIKYEEPIPVQQRGESWQDEESRGNPRDQSLDSAHLPINSMPPVGYRSSFDEVGESGSETRHSYHQPPHAQQTIYRERGHSQQLEPTDRDFFTRLDDDMNMDDYNSRLEVDYSIAQYNHLKNNDLGIVIALQASQDSQDQRLRTYHSFLDASGTDVLATYEPSARDSPLRDSTTARVFCHFINVSGPSISMYERHPVNPSLLFQGRPVPISQQHIWTYTMPTLALNNQALLHAMLAIGSLHIALLQDSPATASLKHYHIAIRRVAKIVREPHRRGHPATLAATLLLGWYELMSADHQKWSSHLLGARQLLMEIDFAGMTKCIRSRRRQSRTDDFYHRNSTANQSPHGHGGTTEQQSFAQDDINENIVSVIMGKRLRYDQYGQILDDEEGSTKPPREYTAEHLAMYEHQRDLFWWYCKQDAFQSILSGNRLFMHYETWSQCPPRAPIGRRDAEYGTYDHVILLLGRLTEFAAKDLKRKRKALQANGGQWRPPGYGAAPAGSQGKRPPAQAGPPMPTFAGMMPGTEGQTTVPRGFSPIREESPSSNGDDRSLEEWTREAEEEWQEICAAFGMLEENYGPDFQPLGPEYSPQIHSPFGPALQYRTYSIAGIWMMHYMGLILCHRYHPSMPPAATIAAGVAAQQTGFYANQIGRISAAIAPDAPRVAELPTGVGAGLIECSFALFTAGVQYQDAAQRAWLVQRCSDVKRLTGWQTANAIAMGCESSWVKAAEAGRGPPYTRTTVQTIDQKIWYTARRRIDTVLQERQDRHKLLVAKTDRVHYALGLIGFEEDFEKLTFEDDDAED